MSLQAAFAKIFPGGPRIEASLEMELGVFGITILFGSSGCGKTTVLRCLAGLERPNEGHIRSGGQDWFRAESGLDVPTPRRRIGLVFQDSALFPHLTVAGNIAYGLKGRRAEERTSRVLDLLERVGLQGLGHRKPRELSGGQKQRVALARALAPEPDLLLLDEPFASLDRPSAQELRHNLRRVLQDLGIPAILVTHNREDALALGDRMILMHEGRILQCGTPMELFSRPGSRDAAERLGLGTLVRTRVEPQSGGLLRLWVGDRALIAPDPGGDLTEAYACIRSEGVSLERSGSGLQTQRNRLPAKVTALHPAGPLVRVELDCGFPMEALITAWACEDLGVDVGDELLALIKASAIHVIPIEA